MMTTRRPLTFTPVTGATSGIGLELAGQAAADGRDLILVARHVPDLKAVAEELRRSVTVHTIAQDLSQPGAAEKAGARTRTHPERCIGDRLPPRPIPRR